MARSARTRPIAMLGVVLLPITDAYLHELVSFKKLEVEVTADKPLTLASYVAATVPEAYIEFMAVGDALPPMPLFLDHEYHVSTPLEETYLEAYRGVPKYWRDVVENAAVS